MLLLTNARKKKMKFSLSTGFGRKNLRENKRIQYPKMILMQVLIEIQLCFLCSIHHHSETRVESADTCKDQIEGRKSVMGLKKLRF